MTLFLLRYSIIVGLHTDILGLSSYFLLVHRPSLLGCTGRSKNQYTFWYMAEVLGVAAGAAGLAGVVLQVFDSANRLRQFCSSVKNVPEDLDILLDEISVFSTVIADCAREEQQQEASTLSSTSTVTKQEQPPSYQSPFTRANEYCRQAATQLETVLGDSYDSCQKKGVRQVLASVKFVFREKEVKKGLQRLERAKSLLSLAQQCLLQ